MSIFNTISAIVSGVSKVAEVGAQVGNAFGIKELSALGGRNLDPYTGGALDVVPQASVMPMASPIAAPMPTYEPRGGGLDYGRYLRMGARAGAWFADNWPAMHRSGSGGDYFGPISEGPGYTVNEQQQLAKLAITRQAIPAQSDLGQALIAGGARTSFVTVSYSDGTRSRVEVVRVGGGRRRVKRRNITRNRLTDAAWVMRKLHAQQKLGRKLVSVAKKLEPARRSCAPAKKRCR